MTPSRVPRESGDPIARLTIFRDHPGSHDEPDPARVSDALRSLYPEADYRIEQRALVVDGDLQVLFEVYQTAKPPPGSATPGARAKTGGWPH